MSSHFIFYVDDDHLDLHSFPTRRSSDLKGVETITPSTLPPSHSVCFRTPRRGRNPDNCIMAVEGYLNDANPSADRGSAPRSEEHTSELQSRQYLVCRLLLEKKKQRITQA